MVVGTSSEQKRGAVNGYQPAGHWQCRNSRHTIPRMIAPGFFRRIFAMVFSNMVWVEHADDRKNSHSQG